MNATLFLRIAAVIALLYFAGHSAGFPWTPAAGPEQLPLLESMKGQTFDAEGFTRTYWDFYIGFGIIISVFLFLQAVVLWQLGSLAKTNASTVRPMIVLFLAASIVNAGVGWTYFFAVPAAMAAAIALCLVIALVLAGGKAAQRSVPADGPRPASAARG